MGNHIYTASMQPATAYSDTSFDPPFVSGFAPEKMLFCEACDECWPASQMAVQCFYDGMRIWCAAGHGCKDKARLEAHAERTRRRRSYAQRMRWLDAKEQKATA